MTDFCRYCGARKPPIEGEGTCQECDPGLWRARDRQYRHGMLMRKVREQRGEYTGPMREVYQPAPDFQQGMIVRWDIAWVDPASKRYNQFCVECWVQDDENEAVIQSLRDTARGCFTRELNRKCGVFAMDSRTHTLYLPTHVACKARFVF